MMQRQSSQYYGYVPRVLPSLCPVSSSLHVHFPPLLLFPSLVSSPPTPTSPRYAPSFSLPARPSSFFPSSHQCGLHLVIPKIIGGALIF